LLNLIFQKGMYRTGTAAAVFRGLAETAGRAPPGGGFSCR